VSTAGFRQRSSHLFRMIGAGGFLRYELAPFAKSLTAGMKLFEPAFDGSAGNNECPKRIHYGRLCRNRGLFPMLFPSRTVTLLIPTHAVVRILADNKAARRAKT